MTEEKETWKREGMFHCPFCNHEWKDIGITKCYPPVFVATCPECLAFGFLIEEEKSHNYE